MSGRDITQNQEMKVATGFGDTFVAPGVKIRYKQSLIGKYCDEHRNIRSLYHAALAAYQAGDNRVFLKQFEALQSLLRDHLLDESLNMYVYLKHYYADDEKKLDLITRFNRNMKKSGMTAVSYIRRFTEYGEVVKHDHDFLSELIDVGNSLEVQLAAEERHLYCLYKSPEGLPSL